jgi:ribosomal protein S27AE
MNVPTIYLHLDHLPYRVQYSCPGCGKENYAILPDHLDTLPCGGCGMTLNVGESRIELLKPREESFAPYQHHAII